MSVTNFALFGRKPDRRSSRLRVFFVGMTLLIDNPSHWHARAEETRRLAAQLTDLVARVSILKIAEEYEALAVRAAWRAVMKL
jgi:hypothetical protein